MEDTAKTRNSAIVARIGARVRELRAARAMSLDALAARSSVSRSMISLIERGEASPTAVVLDKLASGLGVTLASLFDTPGREDESVGPVAKRENQPLWKDPASGYVRRNVSPPRAGHPMQIVEISFPPGARVAFENPPRETPVYQQVWVLEGTIEIALGAQHYRLRDGDCIAMQLDHPTMFHNPTRRTVRYVVVIASEAGSRR
jgi:transcriptional regulator with XRE-family HTH domain